MARRPALLLLLLPGVALAQATVRPDPTYANRANCSSTTAQTTWNWTSGTSPGTGDVYRLAAYAGSGASACSSTVPAAGSSATVENDLTSPTLTDSATIFVANIQSAAGVNCLDANDKPVALCVYLVPVASTSTATLVAAGTFDFWLAVPPAPTLSSVVPANAALKVTVAAGAATSTETAVGSDVNYTVTCRPNSGTGATATKTGNAGQVITCGDLQNGVQYTVTARGTSAAGNGNVGAASAPYTDATATTPLPFVGFWETYQADGGVDQGGCGTGGRGALAPAAAILALLGLRRRRS